MALAEYFSKNLLAISQVLKSGTSEQLHGVLNNTVIGIAFNDDCETPEGKAALDLVIRLHARLYPKLRLIDLTKKNKDRSIELKKLATSINSKIEMVEEEPSVVIIIGNSSVERKITPGPIFYIGSNEWIAKFSSENPMGSGQSSNVFGAGVAACIGASNVFRYIFSDFLSEPEFDEEFSLSLITLSIGTENFPTKTKFIDLGEFSLIGFGAIGNGVIWALSQSSFIKGVLTVVEPENLETTNLQRYVLAEERHIGKPKIKMTQEFLKSSAVKLNLVQNNWAHYLNVEGNWANETVLVAIDNAKDRIGVQASLPKQLINSYTENNLIGISRHYDFINEACLVCTYMPNEEKKSFALQVCENLGITKLVIPEMEKLMGGYLYSNIGADDRFLKWIADANEIEISELEKFKGIPVVDFYSKVVCGGMLMELRKSEVIIESIEAPLAFQSALAGILELAELVINKTGLRQQRLPTKTHFHPLNPVKLGVNPYNHSFTKDITGRCICADKDFIKAYITKWT